MWKRVRPKRKMGIYIPGMAHQKVFYWFYYHTMIPIQERNNKKKPSMALRAFILETGYLMALGSASPIVFVIDSVSSKQDLFPFFLSSGLQAGTGKLESIPTQPKGCLQCLKLKTKCFACKFRCHFFFSLSLFSIRGWLGGRVGGGLMGMENGYMHGRAWNIGMEMPCTHGASCIWGIIGMRWRWVRWMVRVIGGLMGMKNGYMHAWR